MKNILITGGSSGIGAATAKALQQRGHQVLIMGRNQANLEKVSEGKILDLRC